MFESSFIGSTSYSKILQILRTANNNQKQTFSEQQHVTQTNRLVLFHTTNHTTLLVSNKYKPGFHTLSLKTKEIFKFYYQKGDIQLDP